MNNVLIKYLIIKFKYNKYRYLSIVHIIFVHIFVSELRTKHLPEILIKNLDNIKT